MSSDRPILLDTCALIWIAARAPLRPSAAAALAAEAAAQRALRMSPVSAWELGLLVARGRLALALAPDAWLAHIFANAPVLFAPLPPSTLIASSFLPGTPPNDPADRIIIATARAEGFRVMTRDHLILGYGDSGHVATIAC